MGKKALSWSVNRARLLIDSTTDARKKEITPCYTCHAYYFIYQRNARLSLTTTTINECIFHFSLQQFIPLNAVFKAHNNKNFTTISIVKADRVWQYFDICVSSPMNNNSDNDFGDQRRIKWHRTPCTVAACVPDTPLSFSYKLYKVTFFT